MYSGLTTWTAVRRQPVHTPNIESLLDSLQEPLSVVHTVDPRDAEQNCTKWMPPIHKEIGVIERAVQRLPPDEVRSGGWLRRKEVKVVPSKFVFTVKPPRPPCTGRPSSRRPRGPGQLQAQSSSGCLWQLRTRNRVRGLRLRCCS